MLVRCDIGCGFEVPRRSDEVEKRIRRRNAFALLLQVATDGVTNELGRGAPEGPRERVEPQPLFGFQVDLHAVHTSNVYIRRLTLASGAGDVRRAGERCATSCREPRGTAT